METEIIIGSDPEQEIAEGMAVLHDTMKTYCTTKPGHLPTLQEMKANILEYLEQPIPEAWPKWTTVMRHAWFAGERKGGRIRRDRVCAMEVWIEGLGHLYEEAARADITEIHTLLEHAPGWVKAPKKAYCGCYGVQRCFVRIGGSYDIPFRRLRDGIADDLG